MINTISPPQPFPASSPTRSSSSRLLMFAINHDPPTHLPQLIPPRASSAFAAGLPSRPASSLLAAGTGLLEPLLSLRVCCSSLVTCACVAWRRSAHVNDVKPPRTADLGLPFPADATSPLTTMAHARRCRRMLPLALSLSLCVSLSLSCSYPSVSLTFAASVTCFPQAASAARAISPAAQVLPFPHTHEHQHPHHPCPRCLARSGLFALARMHTHTHTHTPVHMPRYSPAARPRFRFLSFFLSTDRCRAATQPLAEVVGGVLFISGYPGTCIPVRDAT